MALIARIFGVALLTSALVAGLGLALLKPDRHSTEGAIPKSGHAAVRLDCFFADGCDESSSSSSSAFNSEFVNQSNGDG